MNKFSSVDTVCIVTPQNSYVQNQGTQIDIIYHFDSQTCIWQLVRGNEDSYAFQNMTTKRFAAPGTRLGTSEEPIYYDIKKAITYEFDGRGFPYVT